MNLLRKLKRLVSDQRAATAVEYGLIASMIVVVIMVSVRGVATETNVMWTRVGSTMAAATGA